MPVINAEIAAVFDGIADLLETWCIEAPRAAVRTGVPNVGQRPAPATSFVDSGTPRVSIADARR